MNYYETTKIVNPCDKCAGKKLINSRSDYHWEKFQKEFTKVFEESPKPLSDEELAELQTKMPKFPALETCNKCKGAGQYRIKISLRDAMIEIAADSEFDRAVKAKREFGDIPY